MPIDTQISLSAILFNTKKIIFLGIVGLISFIIGKLSEPFFNSKWLYLKVIFSLIFVAIMILGVLSYLISNTKDPIVGLFYMVEIPTIIVVVLAGLSILDVLIYHDE